MAAIYIGGLHGIGKTTVGRSFANKFNEFHFVDGSDVFREGTGLDPSSIQLTSDLKAKNDALLLHMLNTEQNIILAGHFFISKNLLYLFDLVCLLVIPTDMLVNRRLQDQHRQRTLEIKHIEQEHLEMYSRFCKLTVNSRVPCLIVSAADSPEGIVDNILYHIKLIERLEIGT